MVKLASVENSFLHSLGSDAAAQGQCQDTRRDRGAAGASCAASVGRSGRAERHLPTKQQQTAKLPKV